MNRDRMALEAAAQAMLRTLGAGCAALTVVQPVTATGTDGLGLATPLAAEAELTPLLVQASINGKELLAITTHGAVARALNGLSGVDARLVLLHSRLRVGTATYRITAVTVKYFGGAELMVELGIEA